MEPDEIMTPNGITIPDEKKLYTEEEVNRIIKAAQERQLAADEMRNNGNIFFAEALDHISTLARGDKAWKTVYEYGKLFRNQFEKNTGQIPKEEMVPPNPSVKQKESKKDPKKDDKPANE